MSLIRRSFAIPPRCTPISNLIFKTLSTFETSDGKYRLTTDDSQTHKLPLGSRSNIYRDHVQRFDHAEVCGGLGPTGTLLQASLLHHVPCVVPMMRGFTLVNALNGIFGPGTFSRTTFHCFAMGAGASFHFDIPANGGIAAGLIDINVNETGSHVDFNLKVGDVAQSAELTLPTEVSEDDGCVHYSNDSDDYPRMSASSESVSWPMGYATSSSLIFGGLLLAGVDPADNDPICNKTF